MWVTASVSKSLTTKNGAVVATMVTAALPTSRLVDVGLGDVEADREAGRSFPEKVT